MPITLLSLFAIAGYLAATILLALPIARLPAPARGMALVLASLSVLTHALLIFGMHRAGLDLHFFASLSLTALGVAALTSILKLVRPEAALGVLLVPMAAVLLGVDGCLAHETAPLAIVCERKRRGGAAPLPYSLPSRAAVLPSVLGRHALERRRHQRVSGLIP